MEIAIKLFGNSKNSSKSRKRSSYGGSSSSTRTSSGSTSSTARSGGKSAKKKKNKGGRVAAVICVLIVIVIIVATAGFVYVGTSVANSETIYPNVYIDGVYVGGMTEEEALTALEENWVDPYADKVLTVKFTDDITLEIAASDVVISDTGAEEAVAEALNYGRDGSFISNTLAYLKSRNNQVELSAYSSVSYDENKIRELVSEAADEINASELENTYTISDDEITVIKGTQGMIVDEDDVFTVVLTAITNGDFSVIEYTPETTEPEDIDLQTIYDLIYVEPVSSVYDPETGGASESVTGVSFDLDEAQILYDSAEDGESVIIPLIYTEPDVTSEELTELLFRDVLATKTTYQSSTSNRITNITLAAEAVNGTVLNPGEEFSFNDIVGERTAEKGYKEADAYAGGEVVQEIGGGICQVSSTIYYCTLYSNLEVTERKCHRYTVSYLPLGLDATVSWGSIDYKFVNNTDYPLKIVCSMSGQSLTVTFYGTKLDDTYVETSYDIVSTTEYEIIEQEDESVTSGTKVKTSGHTGYVVDTYFYLYDGNGTLISKTYLSRSTYSKQDRVILVPVGTLEDEDEEVTETAEPTATPTATPSPTAEPTDEPVTEVTEEPEEAVSSSDDEYSEDFD